MSASIRTFRNVRVRLHRPKSGVWLAGWVTHLARDEARIRLWNFIPMEPGESVGGECYGQGTLARFAGKISAQAGQEIAIDIFGSISYAPSEETPRIYATGLMGELVQNGRPTPMQVLDVSPLSLGILIGGAFTPGAEMDMNLATDMGSIAARVSVANCRADDEPGYYRMGLHILDMARLDRARWGRLVMERAEA